MAAEYIIDVTPHTDYVDRKALLAAPSEAAYFAARDAQIAATRTVYVGNLSFYTEESQVLDHMSSVGPVEDVIMGLNSTSFQPCGFCFVVYRRQVDALAAVTFLNLSRLDDRIVRVEWDIGLRSDSHRIWGRGFTGGQTRDEYRQGLDTGRGGFGIRRAIEAGVERFVADEIVTYVWVPPPASRPVKRPRNNQ